jgi:hypothetical protein
LANLARHVPTNSSADRAPGHSQYININQCSRLFYKIL